MSSLAIFNGLMNHDVNLVKRERNYSGDFSDVSSSSLKGFVQYGNHLITTDKGEELKSTAIVFLKNDCGIDINHPYWIIDQVSPYSRLDMEVLKIDPIDDPRTGNTHHFEIHVR